MVSKTVLACLAVLASISMVQSTTSLGGFSRCVQGLGFINVGCGLGYDLGNLLGGILGVADNLINEVLATLQDLLVGVLKGVGNILDDLLEGLFGGRTRPSAPSSEIPFPSSIDKYILTQYQYAIVFDKILYNKYPSFWQQGALASVYLNIANLLSLQLGIGGSSLGNVPDISETRRQCSLINAHLSVLQGDSNFQQIGSLLSIYLNLLGDNNQSVNEKSFLDANSYLIKIQGGLLQLGGYPSVQEYTSTFAQAYNGLNLGVTIPGLLDVDLNLGGNGGIPYDCGCLKN